MQQESPSGTKKQHMPDSVAEHRHQTRVKNIFGGLGVFGVLALFVLMLLNLDNDRLPYLFLGGVAVFCVLVFAIYVHLTLRLRRQVRRRHPRPARPGRNRD